MLVLGLAAQAAEPDADRGEILVGVAGCAACHTAEDGQPFAGGYALDTRWGRFVGSNLTPDPVHGLGEWEFEDFRRALRKGRSPNGRPYYPAFPYTAFTGISDADLADIWAYLQTVEPVARAEEKHRLDGLNGWRFLLRFWKITGFRKGPFEGERGAYLGEAVAHCGECHTPRGALGNPKKRRALSGTDEPPEPAPNITPAESGIGGWSKGELATFLEDGMTPEGDMTAGEMRRLVKHGTVLLSDEDREALAAWVLGHEAVETGAPRGAERPGDETDGDFL